MQLKRNKEIEFETLKKSHKKQIIAGALAICVIGGALTFATSRAFYKVDGEIDLAKGTVNYKLYDFKIIAMYKSEDGTNYTEITDRMPSSGYVINEEKSYCTINNKTHDTEAKLYTENGKHIFENLAKSDKCYLYFDKGKNGATQILANVIVNENTPDFSQTATTNEGVFIIDDPMYGTNAKTYYWRGAVTNNYVKFANFCWRIVRINGDDSIRLIYDGTTCHANGTITNENVITSDRKYNTDVNRSEYVGWEYSLGVQRGNSISSNAKKQAENWFSVNIDSYSSKVAEGKFCNDRNMASGNIWASQPSNEFFYAAKERLELNNPSLFCDDNDVFDVKIGMITVDEVILAGAGIYPIVASNKSYYLYNGFQYWTMTPSRWYTNGSTYGSVYSIWDDGNVNWSDVGNSNNMSRYVINLKSNITFSDGNGTQSNPYVVE